MLRVLIIVAAGLVMISLLSGCEDSNVEIGLMVIDRFKPGGLGLDREVVLILPNGDAGEEAISRLLVQAQSEGWITTAGPGAAEAIGSHYQDTSGLDHDLSATQIDGEVMSARRTFTFPGSADTGSFTALFAPNYNATHSNNTYSVCGRMNAKAIWQALYAEAVRYAGSHGYETDQIKVDFRYPIAWSIICPGSDVKTSRGTVEDYRGESLVEAKMYGPEFLEEMPITVEWKERSSIPGILLGLVGLAALLIVVVYLTTRRRPSRGGHPVLPRKP